MWPEELSARLLPLMGHRALRGHQLAALMGLDVATIRKPIRALVKAGVLTTEAPQGPGGYLFRVNPSHLPPASSPVLTATHQAPEIWVSRPVMSAVMAEPYRRNIIDMTDMKGLVGETRLGLQSCQTFAFHISHISPVCPPARVTPQGTERPT